MKRFISLCILILCTILDTSAQNAEGGGAYIVNNGKLINCLLTDNYASNGFGVSGTTGEIINCNIFKNIYLNKQVSIPGDMVMDDGAFITPNIQGGIIQFPTGYTYKNVTAIVFFSNKNNDYLATHLWVVSLEEGKAKWQPDASPLIGTLHLYKLPEESIIDKDGKNNTDKIIAQTFSTVKTITNCAATYCRSLGADWYLPAMGQLKELYIQSTIINNTITALNLSNGLSSDYPLISDNKYWSSTRGHYDNASWYMNLQSYSASDYSSSNSVDSQRVRAIKNISTSN